MLLDLCFYKNTIFLASSFLGEKNVYSNSCYSDFFPVALTLSLKIDLFEEKQLFFSTWVWGGGG